MFIAYTVYRNSIVETPAHPTREDAARAIFKKFPKLKSCATCATVLVDGVYKPNGSDIRSITAHDLKVAAAGERVSYPLTVVVHVNAFTHKAVSGYLMVNGVKDGKTLTPKALFEMLAYDPELPVEFLNV